MLTAFKGKKARELREKLNWEELEAKLYIVQQLNQRLATLESEITTSESDQRVSIINYANILHTYKYTHRHTHINIFFP